MTSTAATLADRFEAANQGFIDYISSLTETQWLAPVLIEERSVAALAHHVAWGYEVEINAFYAIATDTPRTPTSLDSLHAHNADEAQEYAEADRDEIVALLRANAAHASTLLRSLTDEQLEKSGVYIEGLRELTVSAWVERVLLGHISSHRKSIGEALAG
ncbi:MAG TPA: DinB family protein [Dehalococcoidia bacterium]|nr:DinB family protein [Dehalococcoidia bacterium]